MGPDRLQARHASAGGIAADPCVYHTIVVALRGQQSLEYGWIAQPRIDSQTGGEAVAESYDDRPGIGRHVSRWGSFFLVRFVLAPAPAGAERYECNKQSA